MSYNYGYNLHTAIDVLVCYTVWFSSKKKKKKKRKKNPPANAGDTGDAGSIPGWVTSSEGGHGHPLQYSCLENSIDGGTWRATVHGVGKSWTQLSTHALIWAGFASRQQQRESHG